MNETQYRIESIEIDASLDTCFDLIADIASWKLFMPAVKESTRISGNNRFESISIRAESGQDIVTWKSDREINRPASTISFRRTDCISPFVSMRGLWTFLPRKQGCIVALEHWFELEAPERDLERVQEIIASNVSRDLSGLKAYSQKKGPQKACAIITGGSRGIGFEIARHFAAAGLNLVISGRDRETLLQAKNWIQNACGDCQIQTVIGDICEDNTITALMDAARSHSPPASILVNNAGFANGGASLGLREQVWIDLIETNFHALRRCTLEFLRMTQELEMGWGRIINIASTGGKQGVKFGAGYSSSKHAVVGLTKALGLEFAQTGITINALCPGFVETDLAIGARERYALANQTNAMAMKTQIEGRVPIGRYIETPEVAHIALALIDKAADGITAQAINICGGLGNY